MLFFENLYVTDYFVIVLFVRLYCTTKNKSLF